MHESAWTKCSLAHQTVWQDAQATIAPLETHDNIDNTWMHASSAQVPVQMDAAGRTMPQQISPVKPSFPSMTL